MPYSVRRNRFALHRREWLGVLAVPVGLAVGITASVGRRVHGAARSSLYAAAGGVVMALQSAFLAATVTLMQHRGFGVFAAWEPYALIPATAPGVMLIESAYQVGPLAASMPMIDSVEPLVAIAIGVTLFGERMRTTPLALGGAAVGLVLFVTGILLLDTSPVTHALQNRQEHQVQGERGPAVRAEDRFAR